MHKLCISSLNCFLNGLAGPHGFKMQKAHKRTYVNLDGGEFRTRKCLPVREAARTFYTHSPSIFEALDPKLYGFVSKTTHFKKAGNLCVCAFTS